MYAALLAFEVPFFELILVGCCHAFLRPATQRKDRAQYVCPPGSWAGLIGFYRSYLLLVVLVLWLVPNPNLAWTIISVICFWWWYALSEAVLAQRVSKAGRFFVLLSIPAAFGVVVVITFIVYFMMLFSHPW
jgi:hypothetical protein